MVTPSAPSSPLAAADDESPRDYRSRSHPRRQSDRLSWLWLVAGLALLPFTTVHAELPLAAWLAPIFVLRFARTQSVRLAIPVVVLVSGAAMAFAWRDMFSFPIGPIIGLAYGLAFSLGYVADRALSMRLSGLARTLVFPLAITTIDWLISTFGILATYGSPAYTQADNLPLLQLASVTGIWGLTFLLHWTAPVANELWEHASDWRASRLSVSLFGSTVVAALLFGSVRLVFFPPTGPTVRLAALADTRERYRAVQPPFFLLQPGTRPNGPLSGRRQRRSWMSCSSAPSNRRGAGVPLGHADVSRVRACLSIRRTER